MPKMQRKRSDMRTPFIDFTFILLATMSILVSIGYYGALGLSRSEGDENGARTGETGNEVVGPPQQGTPIPISELAGPGAQRNVGTAQNQGPAAPNAGVQPRAGQEAQAAANPETLRELQRRLLELQEQLRRARAQAARPNQGAQAQRPGTRAQGNTSTTTEPGSLNGAGPENQTGQGQGPEPEPGQGEIGLHGVLDLRPQENN